MATEGGRSVLVAVEAPVCGPYPRPRARGSSVRTSVPTGGGGRSAKTTLFLITAQESVITSNLKVKF